MANAVNYTAAAEASDTDNVVFFPFVKSKLLVTGRPGWHCKDVSSLSPQQQADILFIQLQYSLNNGELSALGSPYLFSTIHTNDYHIRGEWENSVVMLRGSEWKNSLKHNPYLNSCSGVFHVALKKEKDK